tara:strand:+ start:233 stop:556 length:324 start_codon:yes stop_codon:yes gene_type:complete
MKKGDIVLVETFAGVDVHVKLKEYCSYSAHQKQVAYAGWSAELVYEKDAKSLQQQGCPINVGDDTWVYDWQVYNEQRHLDRALDTCGDKCVSAYEEEIELYRTYGGE